MSLEDKLAAFDAHIDEAIEDVATLLRDPEFRSQLATVARARHITGHHVHGDSQLFEWLNGKIRAEIIEELADAVVYRIVLRQRGAR